MRLGSHVVLFDFSGIPMVGNLDNGFVIGLTENGASLCKKLSSKDLSENEAKACDAALYDCLKENGFFDEPAKTKRLKSAYIHVTQRCNLNCVGCYSLDASRNALEDASTKQMKHAIEQLASLGCRTLFFSGGEPLFRDDLPDLVRHAKDSGIDSVTVITNGTLHRKDILEGLKPYIDRIAVSLDGYADDTPAYIRGVQRFDDLMDFIRLAQEIGIATHLTPTIHAKNVNDLKEYIDLANRLGITMNYSLLSCESGDPFVDELIPKDEELKQLADNLLAMGQSLSLTGKPKEMNLTVSENCGAGIKEVSIAADGTVYPCHMLHRSEWALGNVFENTLSKILDSEHINSLAEAKVNNIEQCSDCGYRLLCGGGCRARSLYNYGDVCHKDPYCSMMHTYYEKLGDALSRQFQ